MSEKIDENILEDLLKQTQNTQDTDEDLQSSANSMPEQPTDWQEKYIRLYAEFDNFRKRSLKEKSELIKSAGEDVIKKILPVLDDFERAFPETQTIDKTPFEEGIFLIFTKFKNTLQQMGLQTMETKNLDFNSDLHESIANLPGTEAQKGKIIDTVEKGYFWNGKIIRYAKVVVGA